MKILLHILIVFSWTLAAGQKKDLHTDKDINSDTSYWYKWKIELCSKTELDSIQYSENNWHFRLWTNKQVIDLWEEENGRHFGKITSWVKQDSQGVIDQNARIYSEYKELDTNQIEELISLIDSTDIKKIPHEDSIEGWEGGLHGRTYTIETVESKNYSFKTYWTPTSQDSLKKAIIVKKFIDRASEITNAEEFWDEFESRIPFTCYRNEGHKTTCSWTIKK